MAGALVVGLAEKHGAQLLPVDSEHQALFSLLLGRGKEEVAELILTASGGAFRELSLDQLANVRVEDAVRHPNWRMGAKITVDSATMANKGLEVMEAHRLFGVPLQAIKVLIHPQSFVHSLVRTVDGFLYAQISQPDMRLSIQRALSFPRLRPSSWQPFELAGKQFTFEPVDEKKYRLLSLAYQAAERSGAYPIVYNAANEVAVERFLERRISFLRIVSAVEEALQGDWKAGAESVRSVEQILQVDGEARRKTAEILDKD